MLHLGGLLISLTYLAYNLISAYRLEGERTFKVIVCLLLPLFTREKNVLPNEHDVYAACEDLRCFVCLGMELIEFVWVIWECRASERAGKLGSAQLQSVSTELAGAISCPPASFPFSINAWNTLQSRLPAGC